MRISKSYSVLAAVLALGLGFAGRASATVVLTDTTIGTNPGPSSAVYNAANGTYSITINGTSSETEAYRNFDYATVQGDFTAVVNVLLPSSNSTSTTFLGGLAVRNVIPGVISSTPASAEVGFETSNGATVALYDDCNNGVCSTNAVNVTPTSTMEVSLNRSGSWFTEAYSTDGRTFHTLAYQQLPLASQAYLGLSTMSYNQSTATTVYSNLSGINPVSAVPGPGSAGLLTAALLGMLLLKRKTVGLS